MTAPVPTKPDLPSKPDLPKQRATALPAEERRSTIVAATLPLLLEHGDRVTSRQIAEAAGIAEGTIFRVFADKDEIIVAVLETALDPEQFEQALGTIPAGLGFEDALAAAVEIYQQRVIDTFRLVSSVGTRFHEMTRRPIADSDALVRLFDAHRDRITVEPIAAARLLRALTLSTTHPMLAGEPLSAAELVDLFLHGVAGGLAVLMKLLRAHLAPYKKWLWLIVVLQSVQTAAALTLPGINARIIDNGVIPGDIGYIWTWGAVMLGFAFIQGGFAIAAVYFGSKLAMSFGRDVRSSLFHRVTDFSAREVGVFGAPSLITRITNDVQQVQMLTVMASTMAIAAPITMVVGLVLALRQDVALSIIIVIAMPVAATILGVLVSFMVPAFRLMQERIDQVNRVLREQITGIRVVRAFVREPHEERRFKDANADLTATSLRGGRLMSAMFPLVNFLINMSSVAVLAYGATLVDKGEIEVGTMVAFLSYLVQILWSVVMATFMVSMIPRASVSADRIQEVLDTETSVVPPSDPVREVSQPGALAFDGVEFKYPGAEHPVLCDISFATSPGQTTAIVGSTGAGKTTLVNLILRLFDSTGGDVVVGGVNVRDLDPEVLWNSVGFVPQKPYLFSGTVRSNLQFGMPDASDNEMWTAVEVAEAADFVRAMPNGLDAHIEQGGTNVSGGQRQRLSIARALIRRPDIYVFDDSFSALDLATDARLRAALVPYTREAAVIIVAQRVSTIAAADDIIVLEDGEIVGRGTHDELLTTSETYAEIVQSQIGEKSAA